MKPLQPERSLPACRPWELDTGTAAPEALPAAKHIFSHIEWHMNGILLHVPAQDAPAGCVWASREALQAEYTLPGAFKSYKKLMV
ncbi:MAG: NUDIX domain-containing protein [Faecalibacterium prausnitzii]